MRKEILLFIMLLPSMIVCAQNNSTAMDYFFFPGNEISIPPNAKVLLSVKQMVNDIPADAFLSHEQWLIDGKDLSNQNKDEGNFKLQTLQFDKGNYTAPSTVPPHNPVIITLSFQPEGQKEKIVLYCRIHIIDKENYFYLSSQSSTGGVLYELKESTVASAKKYRESAIYMNDQWNIGANGFQKAADDNNSSLFMGFGLGVVGNGTGTYTWTVNGDDKTGLKPPCNTLSVTGTAKDGSPFQYMSYDCIPHGDNNCRLVALGGSTIISVFDKKNRIIKGYFSGILVSASHQYVSVSGAFSVYIN